jgi:hypothetical protein
VSEDLNISRVLQAAIKGTVEQAIGEASHNINQQHVAILNGSDETFLLLV